MWAFARYDLRLTEGEFWACSLPQVTALRQRREEEQKAALDRATLNAGIIASAIWNLAVTCKWIRRRDGGMFSAQDFIPRPRQEYSEEQNEAAIKSQIAAWKALAKRQK